MRRASVTLAILAAVALAPTSADAAARCRVKGTRVIERVGRVVVLGRSWGTTYGCLTTTHERRRLPVGDDTTQPAGLRVRGTVVGYWMNAGCFGYCWSVVTVDLHTGRTSVSYRSYAPIVRIAVDRFGHAAWTTDATGRELHVMDEDGEEVVSRDPSIDPASIRLADGDVHWRTGGADRSRRLDRRLPCGLHGSATLTRSDVARVYWIHEKVVGCFNATGRRTVLGKQPVFDMEYYGGGFVNVAGRFATIEEGFAGRGDSSSDLSVFDLATGKRVHRWTPQGDFAVRAVVLHPSGAVAWMYSGAAYGTGNSATVVAKSDATGETVVLGSSDKFDRDDQETLRLDGDVVSWTLSGTPGSAELH